MEWQHCKCGASWLGDFWEACDWCWKRQQSDYELWKQELLEPAWLVTQGLKYFELSEVDREVWNVTRGIPPSYDIQGQWELRMQGAADAKLITPDEHGLFS